MVVPLDHGERGCIDGLAEKLAEVFPLPGRIQTFPIFPVQRPQGECSADLKRRYASNDFILLIVKYRHPAPPFPLARPA